jgi:hypothetical protein
VRRESDRRGCTLAAERFLYRAQDIIADAGICTGKITAKMHGGKASRIYATIESNFVKPGTSDLSCSVRDPVGYVQMTMKELIETSGFCFGFGSFELNILQGNMVDILVIQRIRFNEANLLGIYFDGAPEGWA